MKQNIGKLTVAASTLWAHAVFIRLVGTERRFAIGRKGRGAGRPPAYARERCGRRTPAISARRDRHGCRRRRHRRGGVLRGRVITMDESP